MGVAEMWMDGLLAYGQATVVTALPPGSDEVRLTVYVVGDEALRLRVAAAVGAALLVDGGLVTQEETVVRETGPRRTPDPR